MSKSLVKINSTVDSEVRHQRLITWLSPGDRQPATDAGTCWAEERELSSNLVDLVEMMK